MTNKPREFWIREIDVDTKFEFIVANVALRMPNSEHPDESDFKRCIHVIEKSSYDSLMEQCLKMREALGVARVELKEVSFLSHLEYLPLKIVSDAITAFDDFVKDGVSR